MKSTLISIKPRFVAKILNGEKTIVMRKSMPKCDLPIDVYIYCTKSNYFGYISNRYIGKVVAKFTLNKIRTNDMTNCLQGSCLSYDEVNEYTKGKKFYGWHISNLVIFNRPKELSEFRKIGKHCKFQGRDTYCDYCSHCDCIGDELTKAPQSWCYVESEDKE